MKDLGELRYFFIIKVSRSKKDIFLSQRKYVFDLLNETGIITCSPTSTPMGENLKLHWHSDQVFINIEHYLDLLMC